ncbi:uncharacterized protein B0P05DRAFT_584555 [Gilbertella persicaria]|uniref:uncharacterized protein n=1 Tax=Gilbertella persicaria TaxID=101096 RepID=UPI00221FFAA6|nr:uncharacterized protein B0P05DRAFT_584555 [Gilbertella persicaria]KAI8087850.1 hypothetical protein B0P05DRAFT_584555 [Gilbertella persicaria]
MAPLDIKIEIVLDKNNVKYYPGDSIEAKIFLTSNQNCSLHDFRLNWTGLIQVQPVQFNKENRIYFNECWKLGPTLIKSNTKTSKGNSNVPFYHTRLILSSNNYDPEPRLDLPKNKTVGLSFVVHVPNDRPLPSCTELSASPNKIMYFLEAFILDQDSKLFLTQKSVPVYEAIYTRTPDMMIPQRIEQVFMVSLFTQEKKEFASAMRVTLPCRGSQAGIAIPVSISIWNNMEFTRRQGISVSLFRINQILANGRAYTSQGEKIHRVVADLDITGQDSHNNQKMQVIRVGLPIPKGTMPTITFEQSQLISVSYFIRVQIFAQEGVYTTSEGKKSQFMMVDLPFIVGTLTTPSFTTSSSSSSPVITPLSSPGQTYNSLSSVLNTHQPNMQPSFDSYSSSGKSITDPTSPTLGSVSPESTKKSPRGSISGIFRKSSTGGASVSSGQSSSDNEKKKKSVFSTLKLYSRSKKQTEEPQPEVNPTVIMTPKNEQRGVFNLFDDNITDDELDDNKKNVPPTPAIVPQPEQPTKQPAKVFNMFPDDDSDEEEQKQEPIKEPESQARVFNMFPDDDSDEEGEEMPAKETMDQQPKVFQMFEDDDSDSDESVVRDLQVSTNQAELLQDERVKPHHQEQKPNEVIYKPNTLDDSTTDEENFHDDLLSALALREKLLLSNHDK